LPVTEDGEISLTGSEPRQCPLEADPFGLRVRFAHQPKVGADRLVSLAVLALAAEDKHGCIYLLTAYFGEGTGANVAHGLDGVIF